MAEPVFRPATPDDVAAVARIWETGWRDGHLGHTSDELLPHRTVEAFLERVPERLADTTVMVVDGEIAGFVMVVGDEVDQVYVDTAHRGTGVAGLLLRTAEQLVAAAGHPQAWLAVASGNARARRFYEREGWVDEGEFSYDAPVPGGSIAVPCHRMVRTLRPRPAGEQ